MRSIGLILLLSGFPVIAQGWDNLTIAQVAGHAIVAQQQPDEIDRVRLEGFRLLQEGSKESLVAAISKYETALQLSRAKANRSQQATALLGLGRIYFTLGDQSKAIYYYNQALLLYRVVDDHSGEAATLSNIGLVYSVLSDKTQALYYYNQALLLYRAVGDTPEERLRQRNGEATTLNNIGLVYGELSNKTQALKYYNQALQLFRAVRNPGGEATTLNNIGLVYDALGDKPKALKYYNQSLSLYKVVRDRDGEATALNGIGVVYYALGDMPKALEYYNQALPILRGVGNRSGEAKTLNNIGSVYDDLGDMSKALEYYNQALLLIREVGDQAGEAMTLHNIGYLLKNQKQPKLAITFFKKSVNVRETLRDNLKSLSRNEQALYTQMIAETYRTLANLLIQQGRLAEAQQVIELLKIRELKELESNKNESKQSIQQLPISESEKQEIAKVNPEVAKGIQSQSLPTPDRLSQNPLNQSAQAILTAQPNSALIYQLFTQDKLWIILITPDGKLQRFASSANKTKLESLIAAFRQQIELCEKVNYTCDKTDTQNLNQTSQQLHQQLFPADLQTALKTANPQHLTFALDGSLRNIPIAALHTGTQYLTEQYTLSTLIAAQLTDSQDKLPTNPAQTPILAVGTSKPATIPVPDYIAIDRQDRYRGLSNVPLELDAIVSPTKSSGTFPGLQLLDDQFTLPNLQKQLPQHRILHIASHGIFRPNFLDYSYILLGNNQPWSIAQMDSNSDRKLFQNIHMVSLSTCQSGLGGRDTNGMEIAGMSHAFLSQGAKTVTAALWQVDDASTALFMQHFYQTLAQTPNSSKAAALHHAQLHLLRTPRPALIEQLKRSTRFRLIDPPIALPRPVQKTTDYTHPYYWAAFTLIGNSR